MSPPPAPTPRGSAGGGTAGAPADVDPSDDPPAADIVEARPRGGGVLAVLLAGFFLILLDGTVMNVAIPVVEQDLGADHAAAQWMMSGYALTFGLVLVPAGRLGDRLGHRRMFTCGVVLFTASSVLCALAPTAGAIVAGRVVQGVAAGVMNPAVLALIQAVFPRGPARGWAFAWYGATAGVASSLGPVLGGVVVAADLFGTGWRLIFLVNVPIGLAVVLAARQLPGTRGRGGSVDPLGAVLLALALLAVIYPLIEGYERGWPWWVPAVLAVAPVLGAAFVGLQLRRARRDRAPLIDVRLFRHRSFAGGVGITVTQFMAFASLQFVLAAFLQLGLGRSAVEAGLGLLPFALGTVTGSAFSHRAVARFGRAALLAGAALLTLGTAAVVVTIAVQLTAVDVLALAPASFVAGTGAALLGPSLIGVALADVPAHDAGAAGGVVATAQRVGHATGVALVGTVLFGTLGPGAASGPPGAHADRYVVAVQYAGGACAVAALVSVALVLALPRRW